MPEFPRHLCGWLGVDDNQRRMAAKFPGLHQASPRLFQAPAPPEPVFLYKAWETALGQIPHYTTQQIGDCVSFAHAHANDLLQCVEMATEVTQGYAETDTEFIYGIAHKVSGGLNTPGDGTYGAAAVKAMTEVGMVSRQMLGTQGEYSGDRAKSWGFTGPPEEVEDQAKSFKLGSAARVATWDELVAAISNGYPVTSCFSDGFTMTRDAEGFCHAQGRWGHCQTWIGIRVDRPGACLMQSWGPNIPSGPVAFGQPDFSFWVDRYQVEYMLREGDSWAISNTASFVARPLPPAWKYHDLA